MLFRSTRVHYRIGDPAAASPIAAGAVAAAASLSVAAALARREGQTEVVDAGALARADSELDSARALANVSRVGLGGGPGSIDSQACNFDNAGAECVLIGAAVVVMGGIAGGVAYAASSGTQGCTENKAARGAVGLASGTATTAVVAAIARASAIAVGGTGALAYPVVWAIGLPTSLFGVVKQLREPALATLEAPVLQEVVVEGHNGRQSISLDQVASDRTGALR